MGRSIQGRESISVREPGVWISRVPGANWDAAGTHHHRTENRVVGRPCQDRLPVWSPFTGCRWKSLTRLVTGAPGTGDRFHDFLSNNLPDLLVNPCLFS